MGQCFLRALASTPGLSAILRAWMKPPESQQLEWEGIRFRGRAGLAARFDKNGKLPVAMEMLGFGFMEVGSVTGSAWEGNPQPRLFRIPSDQGLVNRMGLNNEGCRAVSERLRRVRERGMTMPILVNLAKTPDPGLTKEQAVGDYVESAEELAPLADALVINISCPNSGDGKTFEDPALLELLLSRVCPVALENETPVLVKLSPDLPESSLDEVISVAQSHGIRGFVTSNTTTHRQGLKTGEARFAEIGAGGLSGQPLMERTVERVRQVRQRIGADALLIGVGGIFDGKDAARVIEAGANLVEATRVSSTKGPVMRTAFTGF